MREKLSKLVRRGKTRNGTTTANSKAQKSSPELPGHDDTTANPAPAKERRESSGTVARWNAMLSSLDLSLTPQPGESQRMRRIKSSHTVGKLKALLPKASSSKLYTTSDRPAGALTSESTKPKAPSEVERRADADSSMQGEPSAKERQESEKSPTSSPLPTTTTSEHGRGLTREDTAEETKDDGETASHDAESTGTGDEYGFREFENEYTWAAAVNEAVDLASTTDVDQQTRYAPAVTHETVRPHVHEVVHEQIHRDIHTHDVYRYIQPVHDVEFLPARHFVLDPADGGSSSLREVAEAELPPACAGPDAAWRDFPRQYAAAARAAAPPQPQQRSAAGRRTTFGDLHAAPPAEGESVIFHPPTLEYGRPEHGAVVQMNFDEHGRVDGMASRHVAA
ncbi:hypothetical protein F4780DRAFT_784396 [Xylariomycetidae sp. FL0641]|nr:hypothetical protein F4780DRAFT_784396 [Xylariomycetidae sp. FL0641]